MNKDDLKEIKAIIDSSLEVHLASVHEEISDLRSDLRGEIKEVKERLTAEISHVNEKLGNFENREVDKRIQLEVRVSRIEKHVGLPKHA
jgi:regulator of replication initiation timing